MSKDYKKPLTGKEPIVAKFEVNIRKNNDFRKHVINQYIDGKENKDWGSHVYKNITKREAQSLKLISEIGGEQSKALSGLAIRALGDVEFGAVVIGGHLSIGDNDTLSKLIETMAGQISRRGVKSAFYELFKEQEGDDQRFLDFIEIVGKIYDTIELNNS